MIIPPAMPPAPVPTAPTANPNPQANAALASAAVSVQKVARPVQTQTVRAPGPVGRTEDTRSAQSSTFRGRQYDAEAETVEQQGARGFKLDVSV